MISLRLRELARCPECHGQLELGTDRRLTCPACVTTYGPDTGDYLDLRPATEFGERTKYLDDALHVDARHETVSPPLLTAGVKHRMLRRMLAIDASDRVLDLGCGSGRVLVWDQGRAEHAVGLDVSPFFAKEALDDVDLTLGDLRRLPFDERSFTKAYALDVFEHLSRSALEEVLREAARVLVPGGTLFAYSRVRRNSRLALGLRWINALGTRLDRLGLIDTAQERLRKSDHINPLVDIDDLRRVGAQAGFRLARIRCLPPGGSGQSRCSRSMRRSSTIPDRRSAESTGRCWSNPCAAGESGSVERRT